jgi:hypothetical protein
VEPGDRLLLQVVEVDVPSGHYRLSVLVSEALRGKASSYGAHLVSCCIANA